MITVRNKRGKHLADIEFNFGGAIVQAENLGQHDPISEVGLLVQGHIENSGYQVCSDEISRFQMLLGRSLSQGEIIENVTLTGDRLSSMRNKRNIDSTPAPPESAEFSSSVFETTIMYPHRIAKQEYEGLVGVEDIKARLEKEGSVLISRDSLEAWSKQHHKDKIVSACSIFEKRLPLIVFGGDVGTGKTALAESFGDMIARKLNTQIILLKISVQTRGSGLVGEMTQLINKAFKEAQKVAREEGCPVILLLDEADTLAQSREAAQMHHEDRAGVNALIQGIDDLKASRAPMLVVFCTNRIGAIDPAIKRRAAIIHDFKRPKESQLAELLSRCFGDIGLTKAELTRLAKSAGPNGNRTYGFTYSDVVTRLVPAAVMESYPDSPLSFERISTALDKTSPTPPFSQESGD